MPITELQRGGPGRAVASNVRAIREGRRLGQQQLSARLLELGRPISPTALSKVEDGKRRVDADDLVALAIALNVSPVRLLLPNRYDDEPVELTPRTRVASSWAWTWAEGWGPLSEPSSDEEQEDYDRERPTPLRRLVHEPMRRAAEQIRFGVMRLRDYAKAEDSAGRRKHIQRYLQYTRREMRVLMAELDRLEAEVADRG